MPARQTPVALVNVRTTDLRDGSRQCILFNAERLSILGLMEIRLWAQAKREGLPIKTVFCNTIAAVQEGLQ